MKNNHIRCAYSNKIVGNNEVVLTRYALDYVKKQGYAVFRSPFIKAPVLTIFILLLLPLLVSGGIPSAVTNITNTNITHDSFTSTWFPTVDGNETIIYRIELYSGRNYTNLTNVFITNDIFYIVTDLDPSHNYTYRIQGISGDGHVGVYTGNNVTTTTFTAPSFFYFNIYEPFYIVMSVIMILLVTFLSFVIPTLSILLGVIFGFILLFSGVNIWLSVLILFFPILIRTFIDG